MPKTITELIMQYFRNHPNQTLKHAPVVDWVSKEYLKHHPKPPRDPWRTIRSLHEKGILIKVDKGIYKYNPEQEKEIKLFNFDKQTKEKILERDNYKCVVCGKGEKDGVELVIDHKKPREKGGDNSIENGQTLCMKHNLMKKNYSQTEAGKKYFIQIYKKAIKNTDKK